MRCLSAPQDVEIELQVLGKDVSSLIPNFLEAQLAKLFTLIIGIEDFVVKGTLQIALRPLMRRVPIVGALQVAFTEVPHFNFKPTIEGGPLAGALGAMLPSIKSWLDSKCAPISLLEKCIFAGQGRVASRDAFAGGMACTGLQQPSPIPCMLCGCPF